MPKTGYVLSEKEVARIHKSLDKIATHLLQALKENSDLKVRFPVSSTINLNTTKSPS
jgi:hypothetical protein